MLIELLDQRLAKVLPKAEYLRLKTESERAFSTIESQTPEASFQNILNLLTVMNEVQQCLLENLFRERYDHFEMLSRHPIA